MTSKPRQSGSPRSGLAKHGLAQTSVFLVCPIRVYCDCLAEKLSRDQGFRVLGSAETPELALQQIPKVNPEVVIVDVSSGSPGYLRDLAESTPNARLVAIGIAETTDQLLAWAEVGAEGYVPVSASFDQMREAVRSTARGEPNCSPRVVLALIQRVRTLAVERSAGEPQAQLTWRELEVLELISQRLSNKEIASRLSIEVPTVKTHVHNILQKLQLHKRAEAAAFLRNQATLRAIL